MRLCLRLAARRVATLTAVGLGAGCAAGGPARASAAPADGGPLPAGVLVSARDVTYEVAGANAAELRDAMLRAGPREAGVPRYASHAWDVRWRFRWAPAPGGCAVRRPIVTLTSKITLPRWRPPADAAPGLVADWEAFLAALRAHELGHHALARRTAGDIARALAAVRAPGCVGIEADANAAARTALDRGRVAQRRYDAATSHGTAEGAGWPRRTAAGARPNDASQPTSSPTLSGGTPRGRL